MSLRQLMKTGKKLSITIFYFDERIDKTSNKYVNKVFLS